MSIVKKLGERRMFQIAFSYAFGAWLFLQMVDQLADRGIVPELIYKLALIWVVIGIPASLLIGWHHGEKGKQKAPLSEIALLAVLAVIAMGMSASSVVNERELERLASATDNPLEMRSVAVLYFEDTTPDQEYQYLADGLTEELIAELSQVQGLQVVSRNGSALFRGSDAPLDSIARVLGAGTLIEGSLTRRGSTLRVFIGLVEGQSGRALPKNVSFTVDASEALTARDSMITQASRLLREFLGDEIRVRQTAAGTRSPGAWTQLQRAEKLRKDAETAIAARDMPAAIALFESADSLLAEVEQIDGSWDEPSVLRATIAYRRARLVQNSPSEAMPFIDSALSHSEEALRRSRTSARALEMRGASNYLKWLFRVMPDALQAERLFESAKADLLNAVRFDRSLASAHAMLSHVYYQTDELTEAVLAAQNALDADAFLESAPVVIWRLFIGNLELANFAPAQRWCDEGRRRMPDDFRFVKCRLWLMITPGVESPSIDTAWALLARQDSLTPAPQAEIERVLGEMFVAGAIARAARHAERTVGVLPLELHDSASAVLRRAANRATEEIDPTRALLQYEAYVSLLLGDKRRAMDLLNQRFAAVPLLREQWRGSTSWWWRELETEPRFRELIGLN
jgi:eukaryotic-like serine/threonine-protein kinase